MVISFYLEKSKCISTWRDIREPKPSSVLTAESGSAAVKPGESFITGTGTVLLVITVQNFCQWEMGG
jgi:hypothetical protein